jgi:hypothetical protein
MRWWLTVGGYPEVESWLLPHTLLCPSEPRHNSLSIVYHHCTTYFSILEAKLLSLLSLYNAREAPSALYLDNQPARGRASQSLPPAP